MTSVPPGHFDDYPPPVGEEPSHPERHQDPGQTNLGISEMQHVVVNTILATFCFAITLLFRFVTDFVPDSFDDYPPSLGEEPSYQEHTQDSGETHLSGVQRGVITAIRATDLTLGLRWIPAGFHMVVKADGAKCQTSNKPVHVYQAIIEWNERILLPCEPSSKVRVNVYASFELGPMLCHGELLRTFEISVGELLGRSEKSLPIIFQPKQQEVASPCTSLFMTVEQRLSDENDATMLCPLTTLMSSDVDALILRTDAGHSLLARYRRTQNSRDLDQSINHFERASDLCPIDHPCCPAALFNLATAKFVSCQVNRTYLDLDIPITLFEEALDLRPICHPDRTITQLHLAISLLSRFSNRGFQTDVDAAKELLSKVLDVCHPNSHIHRAALVAIETSALHPAGSIDANIDANDLGQERPAASMLPLSPNQLAAQAEWCLERNDPHTLDEGISLHYDPLGYYNTMHACRGQLLCNLSVMLATRFERRGNDEDLDKGITLQREALALRPVGHIYRSISLNNLANPLSSRFDHRGNDGNLDEAIALHREALSLRPVGHTDRSTSLNNLGNQLTARFGHRRNGEDLDESREDLRCALTLLMQPDPRRLKAHLSLATVYLSFHHSGLDGTSPGEDTDSVDSAMHHLKAAVNVVSGSLLSRLQASLRWVYHASQYSHGTELEAYATSMQLLDTCMSATASISSRHSAMKDFPRTLAVDAASCALHSGDVHRAVELLEQGRTLIWTQIARLRTPLDSLQTHGAHAVTLMKRFRHLSSLLEKPPVIYANGTQRVDVEAEEARYRRLVEDWNRVVEEIRKIKGFSRFLLPPLFSDLQDAARDGPIIMLIASGWSCNAIIIPHTQPPTSIQLATSVEKLQTLVAKFQRTSEAVLKNALTELWDDVIRPVVENLGGFVQRGSRIWWCPTSVFNFLPLHAAGEYNRKHGQFLSRLYISSYTPSLTALLIANNHPDGALFTLNGVEPELELVRNLLPLAPDPPSLSAVAFTKITSVDATKSRALRALQDNTWLHFACHGTQNYEEPFKSAFLMRDQPLSLHDITQMDLSHHSFAFLSACDTAVGTRSTPDEVIHLAAGLQFVGIKSVVGTLWQVDDSTVQHLVEAFYKNLCGDGKMNSKRAARALHRAVQSLASDKDIPLEQRIVFIHIGI
ncbi:CHAT domain-containing protein [Suillus lakei]|nr:CHAT domain-containing protein [Suillus lakei]